jgi:RNase adaptor protein for sRNA GlmZ degradation
MKIYTFGKRKQKNPPDSEHLYDISHYNSILPSYLRNKNGTNYEVIDFYISQNKFLKLSENIYKNICNAKYNIISICCNLGKHRSVCMALYLKHKYFPDAEIINLSIN